MTELTAAIKTLLKDFPAFCQHGTGITLRSYQSAVAQAVLHSVFNRLGYSFVVIFPRQSGKNELQANLEAYLLTLYSHFDAEMVKVSPTYKPQTYNAMRRLERVLKRNLITQYLWRKERDYIYRVGDARIYFLSGSPTTNIVGATASLLLEVDEAQDISLEKYDKEINPMAASTNATRVFYGTAWTSQTLLAREMRTALEAQKRDGNPRVFLVNAEQVSHEVPEYRKFVAAEIAKLGRNHPLVKTQYFSEEIDAQAGMFPASRLARMQGTHARLHAPAPERIYAFLVDVAGEEGESSPLLRSTAPARDSTVLTVVEVDLASLSDPLVGAPTYRVVERKAWTGVPQTSLYAEIRALMKLWSPRYLVIDATGIGAGLASFLARGSEPTLTIPFTFNRKSKSDLGWAFLAIIESGRFQDYADDDAERQEFIRQCRHCQMEVLPGPNQVIRWEVPAGSRDPATGDPLHDDYIISAALCAALEDRPWGSAESAIISAPDILKDLTL